ncbi:peptidoglycan DD-metalloendopeptidase family protein [Sandarakinorhabdus limnophila]|uniref:peptidoglycan DD-metalloendopeptidase family protein n=1 Tax=Sandarakinorhabdus limnophila TaxID=210512 RepID=UPI0026E9CB67|nr:peptidoglycan DD-metalloendopeptidase family protein [Sandarakinorhabdus limnophila]
MYQPGFQPAAGGSIALPGSLSAPGERLARAGRALARAADAERLRLADDWQRLRRAAAQGDIDLDLGSAIGSRRWWMKLAACTALVGGAMLAGSIVPPLYEAAPAPLTPAQRDEARAYNIAPLVFGGVSGVSPRVDPSQLRPLAEAPERPRVERSVTIGRRGLAGALRNAGVGAAEVAEVTRLLAGLNPGGSARAELVLGRRETKSVPRPLESLALRAAFDLRVEISRGDGGLILKRIPIRVDSTPLRVSAPVSGSLNRALRSAGIPAGQAAEFIKQMRHVVDFQRGLGKADRFDIIIEQDRAETGEIRHGKLLFGALARKGRDPVEIGLWKGEYYQASGEGVKKGLMKTPVDGARMTSSFGMRLHPVLGFSRMHKGVDFNAGHGQTIMAAGGGTVSFAGWHGGHGKYVMIRHNKDLATAYAHMSRIDVRPGQRIGQGQRIGAVGSTGLSTGPHLHYEVWLRGKAVNPVSLRFIGGAELGGRDLNDFQRQMNRWRALDSTGAAPKAVTAD